MHLQELQLDPIIDHLCICILQLEAQSALIALCSIYKIYADDGLCLVSPPKVYFLSHRMFGHMHVY
jgi:hypothetical protein